MATASGDIYWDPFDTEIDTDPYEVWRRLRDEAPLYRNERYDFWALSRFADVQAAHTDHKTFSSAKGTVLEHMGTDLATTNMIIFMDPPQHDTLRALVSRAFTPRRVSELEDRIRDICRSLLDPHVGGTGFDYVVEFAQQLPSTVISALLGVPEDEREEVRKYIDAVFHIEPGVGMVNDVSLGAQIWLFEYITSALQDRRRSPRDDLFTALTQAEIPDEQGGSRKLTDEEAAAFGNLLVSAGTETVARLLGWAAVTLPAFPDQRQMMADDASVIPAGVEELLRFEAPSPVQGRWTTRDVELHGVTVPKDSKVLLLTGAAGRDERRYPDPDRFDVTRDQASHVSFGFGIHFCLGAALARLEGRIGLEETLARFPEWDVEVDSAVQQHTSTVRGWSSVPIRI
ncbi:MAG: cytochrome P450 [Acidobacteriota bacterium]|nr:cytochrome P450 [Acidobacteriota bacterium]